MMEETTPNNQTNLLTAPQDVVYDCIFPLLDYGDLLRLRRVCKPIKAFADECIRNNYKDFVRKIDEANYPLSHFLHANLPTPSIHLHNSTSQFFEDPAIPQFLNLYGDKITHLRVNCSTLQELQFYTSLPNLQHLELDCIDARKLNDDDISPAGNSPFPANFKNLKTLKLNEIWVSNIENLEGNWNLITFCENLEYLKFHPLIRNIVEDKTISRNTSFDFLIEYIEARHRNNPHLPNLQIFDLGHHKDISDYRKFRTLVGLCYKYKIKLVNVPSVLVDRNLGVVQLYPKPFTTPLVSLRNVLGFMMLVELPNLESLVIESTKLTTYRRFWPTDLAEAEDNEDNLFDIGMEIDEGERGRGERLNGFPKWPNLKNLDLTIDSTFIRTFIAGNNVDDKCEIERLFRFLFPGEKSRERLTELAIRFKGRIEFGLPVPQTRVVTKACPFVTKLTLTNWFGRDEEVSRFWEGLPLLEDVVLEKCKLLGDDAFVGTDKPLSRIDWNDEDLDFFENWSFESPRKKRIPAFLGLKHLKKVSLKNLELMPGITDQSFQNVFRHLKVEQFVLTSERPINTITLAGIESLLSGDFNIWVEKFSFNGWSLVGVSDEDFSQLKLRFRASHMR